MIGPVFRGYRPTTNRPVKARPILNLTGQASILCQYYTTSDWYALSFYGLFFFASWPWLSSLFVAPQIPASRQNLQAVALHTLKHCYGCRSLHATTLMVSFAPARTEAPFLPTIGIWNVLCINTKPNFNNALFIIEAEACQATCVASLHYTVLTRSLNCARFPPWIQPAVYPRLRLSAFSFISCAI